MYVRVGQRAVALPEGPMPSPLVFPEVSEQFDIEVVEEDGSVSAVSMGVAEESITHAISLPPVAEGVMWLVRVQDLGRFPEREDLVAPSVYELVPRSELEAGPDDYALEDWVGLLKAVTREFVTAGSELVDIDI